MPTAQRWRTPLLVLIAGCVILSLNMGLRQTHGLFVEPMSLDLGISRGSIGFALALQNLIWGLLTPVTGAVADRYGTGRVLLVGGVLYGLGTAVMALGESALTVTLGGGALIGLAVSACGFPLVFSAVARSVPAQSRSMAMGVVAAGGSIGQMALPPLAQWMIEDVGWAGALLAIAVLALLIVPLAAPLAGRPKDDGAHGQQTLGQAVAEARRHPGFWLLNGGFFVCGFHVAFIGVHLPGYLVTCNLAPMVGATALAVIGFFNTLGTYGFGWLGDRFRKKYLLSLIYLGRAAVMGVFLAVPVSEASVMVFAAVFGILWLSTVPLTSGLVAQIFGPRYMATLFGIVMMSHQVGAFFGAWLGGLSFDVTGSYDPVWAVAVVLGVLASVLHWPIADRPVARLAGATR
jgi:predicted MFS family arabinose efflux permease